MNKNLFGTGKLQACKEIIYGEEYVLFCLDYYGTILLMHAYFVSHALKTVL